MRGYRRRMTNRIVAIGDTFGIPITLRVVDPSQIVALVGAAIRPQQHDELRVFARQYGLPLLIQPKGDSDEYPAFVDRIRDLAPTLLFVNSYSMLIRQDLLNLVGDQAINVHGGLLPRYRGCNPTQWCILNRETETGVTLHYMTQRFDAGDIISQRRVPIEFEDTWVEVQARLAIATEQLLRDELPAVLIGRNPRIPQDELEAVYRARRHPSDGRFDWSYSVRTIYDLVRAVVRPHPGAFTEDATGRLVLDTYRPIAEIAALKFGPTGRQVFTRDRVLLSPIHDAGCVVGGPEERRAMNQTIRLEARSSSGCPLGEAVIQIEDWGSGRYALSLRNTTETRISESDLRLIRDLVVAFAETELGLATMPAEILQIDNASGVSTASKTTTAKYD